MGTAWIQDMQTAKQSELRYSYRFICNESYYGESCSKKCTPRDDRFGHYTCTREGQLSCLPGWKGKYCEERKQKDLSFFLCSSKGDFSVGSYSKLLPMFSLPPVLHPTLSILLKEALGSIAALLHVVLWCTLKFCNHQLWPA